MNLFINGEAKMRNNKDTFYKICPYICGLIYGILPGIGFMSIFQWTFFWFNGLNNPMEYKIYFVIDTIAILGISLLSLVCFIATVVLNFRVFKKTSPTVLNIICEIAFPFLTFLPSALLCSVFFWFTKWLYSMIISLI